MDVLDLLLFCHFLFSFSIVYVAENRTYFAYNGSSTIDLIFYKGSEIKLLTHKVCYTSTETPLKKHCPIAANFSLGPVRQNKPKINTEYPSRKIDCNAIIQNKGLIKLLDDSIKEYNLDAAALALEETIKNAIIPKTKRRAKQWFDAECFEEKRRVLKALHVARTSHIQEDLKSYQSCRKKYKGLLKQKRNEHIESKAAMMIEEARSDPYVALRPRKQQKIGRIDMTTWEEHFQNILNTEKIHAAYEPRSPEIHIAKPFKKEEVERTILSLKNNKAAGPDGILNEHLKAYADALLPALTDMYNMCLRLGNIPTRWKTAMIRILYKGKGDTSDPNSFRGIALENNLLKLLTRLLAKRLTNEIDYKIPDEQFGFRPGRNTLQAVQNLIGDIENTLRFPQAKFYAIFIDYSKAFDTLKRSIILSKLEALTKDKETAVLIHNILVQNIVLLSDTITISQEITQTNGVLQGDPLSPLLFNIATHDVVENIKQASQAVKIYIYADDMVIGSHDRAEVQKAINAIECWAENNKLQVNTRKTVQMTFRKGGRETIEDHILYKNEPLQTVSSFNYLGVTLQPTGKSYRIHIKRRATAATKAMFHINMLSRLSLETAMTLFDVKIVPTLTYGIELVWEKLSMKDLNTIEAVKARFLKLVLGVSKYTRSRLSYELARETFLIEDLRIKYFLPCTENWTKLLTERKEKRMDIWPEFYATEAMINRTWTGTNQDSRHFFEFSSSPRLSPQSVQVKVFPRPKPKLCL